MYWAYYLLIPPCVVDILSIAAIEAVFNICSSVVALLLNFDLLELCIPYSFFFIF